MMTRRAFALGFVTGFTLVACAPDTSSTGFRDTRIPLTVTTRDTLSALDGVWFVRAYFPGDSGLESVSFSPGVPPETTVEFEWDQCQPGSDCVRVTETQRGRSLGQNRLRVTGGGRAGARELWLVWIDEGRRTAAIGTPDGSFGWILDRSSTGGQDRITAAREVLAFNGYMVGMMKLKRVD
ncbi:MAG: hypothetical protein AAF484_15450 [Pseudomonadota bacterium]